MDAPSSRMDIATAAHRPLSHEGTRRTSFTLESEVRINTRASTVVGIEVSKNALQAQWVVPESGEIRNSQIERAKR